MSVAGMIRRALPDRWQVPARYYHQRMIGILERELDLAVRSVPRGTVVVDVGANFGVFSYAFLRRGATVHAFEPQPACLAVLDAYARLNGALRVHPTALGATRRRARLSLPLEAPRDGSPSATLRNGVVASRTLDVDVEPLDGLDLSNVSMMKIDVEGAEVGVLEGAAETITRSRPLLMIEIEQRHHDESIDVVFSRVRALDYSGHFLDADHGLRAVRGEPTEVRDLNERGINNFLFTPRDGSRQWAL